MRDLEAYIFDQDGTLYSRRTLLSQALSENTRDWLLAHVQPPLFFEELRSQFPNFTDALHYYGLTLSQWHQVVCDPLSARMDTLIERDPRLIDFLTSLPGNSYLVTLSSAQFTRALLRVLNLEDHFRGVFNLSMSDKSVAYTEIQNIEGLAPDRIGVFGDNQEIDLGPARKLGFRVFPVDSARSITEQYE